MRIRIAFLCAIVCLLLIGCGCAEAQPQPSPRVQAEALFVEAQKALARGDSENAEAFLKEALTKEPAFTSAIWQLAQIYETRGKLDYARELLLRGLKQDPRATWAKEKLAQMEGALSRRLLAEAQASMNAGDYDLAISKLSTYLGLKPDDETALICMSKCHLAKGNLETATEYVKKARMNDPADEGIASVEAEINNRVRSAMLDRLVSGARAALADSLSGGHEQAQLALQAVLREDPGNSWAKEQLSEVNRRLDQETVREERAAKQNTDMVVERGRQALETSKGILAAMGTFVRRRLTLFILAAVLCALIFDIHRKTMRRSYPLEGTLSIIPILDIVSLINSNLRTGRLIIVSTDAKGDIYFEKGEIIHARCEQLRGKSAFHKLMDLRSGRYFFHNHLPNVRHTIMEPLSLLLLSMKPYEERESELDRGAHREKITLT
jgi:tetratricopeptide (TPR) repeat protein